METLRAAIINCRERARTDDDFIQGLNSLIMDHGAEIPPIIFRLLANVELTPKTAHKYWQEVQAHRRQMIHQLGRHVTLTTAISDYLQLYTSLLHNVCLVDSGDYERTMSGTNRDNLTRLYNRTYFNLTFEKQLALAQRYRTDLSVLFIDLDNFKEINDKYGHLTGDFALREVASIILANSRESDIAVRYGGEEFVMLMPNTTSSEATILAERIRTKVAKTVFNHHGLIFHLTLSGGLSSYPQNASTPKDLLFMADSAVYLAKGSGKNTISQFRDDQRRHLRVNTRRPLLIRELNFTVQQPALATCVNIGLGGIFIKTDTPLPIGSMQEMSITMDNEENLKVLLIGKVIRTEKDSEDGHGAGIIFSFQEMAKEASDQISAFLHDRVVAPHVSSDPLYH